MSSIKNQDDETKFGTDNSKIQLYKGSAENKYYSEKKSLDSRNKNTRTYSCKYCSFNTFLQVITALMYSLNAKKDKYTFKLQNLLIRTYS